MSYLVKSHSHAIASTPLPDWSKFWSVFCGVCDRCQTEEQLEKMIAWAFNQKAYLAHPENQVDVENKIAEIQSRISF